MTICYEKPLAEFEFWAGAKAFVKLLTIDELEEIETWIEELQSETHRILTETMINDFFWFGQDVIADILGYCSEDCMWEHLTTRTIL